MPYRPSEIEPLWQAHWESHDSYVARIVPGQPKFYALDMFPYPVSYTHLTLPTSDLV